MSEYVTHKELMESLIKMTEENKKDRHELVNTISGPIASLHNKMDEVVILTEKVKNHESELKEIKNDIHEIKADVGSINQKLWKAAGIISVISILGGTGVTYFISVLTK